MFLASCTNPLSSCGLTHLKLLININIEWIIIWIFVHILNVTSLLFYNFYLHMFLELIIIVLCKLSQRFVCFRWWKPLQIMYCVSVCLIFKIFIYVIYFYPYYSSSSFNIFTVDILVISTYLTPKLLSTKALIAVHCQLAKIIHSYLVPKSFILNL